MKGGVAMKAGRTPAIAGTGGGAAPPGRRAVGGAAACRSRLLFGAYQSALFTFLIFQVTVPAIGGTCAALSLVAMAVLVIPSSYQRRMRATTACFDNVSPPSWSAGEAVSSRSGAASL